MSTLQQCDTGFDYALDLARHTFTAAKLNPVALAYALGLRITVTPSNDRPASGAAIFTGTADSDGSYRLAITYLGSAFSGTPAAKAAVDMYHYSYAVPIAQSSCPIESDFFEGRPEAATSAIRAMFQALNAKVDEHLAASPAAVPSQTVYDLAFPGRQLGIIIRLHVRPVAIGDPALDVPASFRKN